jgi:N-acetyl-gamma-glutamyl-phosphate reductase
MIRVAIIGASGYTGAETIRILLRHGQAEATYLTALPEECGPMQEIFPEFRGRCELPVEPLDLKKLADSADVALCCLPHKVSMQFVPQLLKAGVKAIDFSADYRLKDVKVYEQYYKTPHTDTANLTKAAYGLPELFRKQIKKTKLVANPGCFPTCSILALAPLLREGLVETSSVIVNSVTGVSGGGKSPTPKFHFPYMDENLFAYGIGVHRHMPEMEQIAGEVAGSPVRILFQPHVGPFDRGMISTVYCRPKTEVNNEKLLSLYADFYKGEHFVQVCRAAPAVKDVTGTNYCHVFPTFVKDMVVVFSVIDNLTKGASGQAIQNMNILFGIEETTGLK